MYNYQNTHVLLTATRLKLSEQYDIDQPKGEIIWNNNQHNCENHDFNILYDGSANLNTITYKQ